MALHTTGSPGKASRIRLLAAAIKAVSAMPLSGQQPTVVRIEGPLSQWRY